MVGSRYRTIVLSVMVLAAGGGMAVAAEGLQPISPGAADRIIEITEACPTFSWSAPWAGPRSTGPVTVVVVDAADEQDVVLAASLPGGARSWTPSAEQCLERGRSYRWFVLGGVGRGHAFAISHLPSETAIAWARDVLHRHLDNPAPTPAANPSLSGAPPAEVASAPRASPPRIAAGGQSKAPVESAFSGDAAVGILGAAQVVGVRAVKTASSTGHVIAKGSVISRQSPLLGNGITFTDSAGNSQIVVSPPDLNFDLEINGWVAAGSLDATTVVGATTVQVPSGSFTGDDGGTGVEYVDVKDCGFLGLDKCIRVDENNTFCTGGSFVVAARLWQTDDDQIGVQVKCTDPLPLSPP